MARSHEMIKPFSPEQVRKGISFGVSSYGYDISLADEFKLFEPDSVSELDPNSGNNTVNPQAGRFQIATWHYLTDSDKWYVIDTNLMNQSLFWFYREPLTVVPKVEDETWRATWIAYMRYSFGWADWRWIIGSNPS